MAQERQGGVWYRSLQLEKQHVVFSGQAHQLSVGRRLPHETFGPWGIGLEEEEFEPVSVAELPGGLVAFAGIASAVANLASQVESLKTEVSELKAELESRPVSRAAHIHDLGREDMRLASPIEIVIEEFSEEVVARFPEVEAFASADSEFEAIEFLKADIAALYVDLAATPADELGRAPKRWLEVLTLLIQK